MWPTLESQMVVMEDNGSLVRGSRRRKKSKVQYHVGGGIAVDSGSWATTVESAEGKAECMEIDKFENGSATSESGLSTDDDYATIEDLFQTFKARSPAQKKPAERGEKNKKSLSSFLESPGREEKNAGNGGIPDDSDAVCRKLELFSKSVKQSACKARGGVSDSPSSLTSEIGSIIQEYHAATQTKEGGRYLFRKCRPQPGDSDSSEDKDPGTVSLTKKKRKHKGLKEILENDQSVVCQTRSYELPIPDKVAKVRVPKRSLYERNSNVRPGRRKKEIPTTQTRSFVAMNRSTQVNLEMSETLQGEDSSVLSDIHICDNVKDCNNFCLAKAVLSDLDRMSDNELKYWYRKVTGEVFVSRNGEKVRGKLRRMIKSIVRGAASNRDACPLPEAPKRRSNRSTKLSLNHVAVDVPVLPQLSPNADVAESSVVEWSTPVTELEQSQDCDKAVLKGCSISASSHADDAPIHERSAKQEVFCVTFEIPMPVSIDCIENQQLTGTPVQLGDSSAQRYTFPEVIIERTASTDLSGQAATNNSSVEEASELERQLGTSVNERIPVVSTTKHIERIGDHREDHNRGSVGAEKDLHQALQGSCPELTIERNDGWVNPMLFANNGVGLGDSPDPTIPGGSTMQIAGSIVEVHVKMAKFFDNSENSYNKNFSLLEMEDTKSKKESSEIPTCERSGKKYEHDGLQDHGAFEVILDDRQISSAEYRSQLANTSVESVIASLVGEYEYSICSPLRSAVRQFDHYSGNPEHLQHSIDQFSVKEENLSNGFLSDNGDREIREDVESECITYRTVPNPLSIDLLGARGFIEAELEGVPLKNDAVVPDVVEELETVADDRYIFVKTPFERYGVEEENGRLESSRILLDDDFSAEKVTQSAVHGNDEVEGVQSEENGAKLDIQQWHIVPGAPNPKLDEKTQLQCKEPLEFLDGNLLAGCHDKAQERSFQPTIDSVVSIGKKRKNCNLGMSMDENGLCRSGESLGDRETINSGTVLHEEERWPSLSCNTNTFVSMSPKRQKFGYSTRDEKLFHPESDEIMESSDDPEDNVLDNQQLCSFNVQFESPPRFSRINTTRSRSPPDSLADGSTDDSNDGQMDCQELDGEETSSKAVFDRLRDQETPCREEFDLPPKFPRKRKTISPQSQLRLLRASCRSSRLFPQWQKMQKEYTSYGGGLGPHQASAKANSVVRRLEIGAGFKQQLRHSPVDNLDQGRLSTQSGENHLESCAQLPTPVEEPYPGESNDAALHARTVINPAEHEEVSVLQLESIDNATGALDVLPDHGICSPDTTFPVLRESHFATCLSSPSLQETRPGSPTKISEAYQAGQSSGSNTRQAFTLALSPSPPSQKNSTLLNDCRKVYDAPASKFPRSRKGILKTNLEPCTGPCKCQKCASIAGRSKIASDFASSQMRTIEEIHGLLVGELQRMRRLVDCDRQNSEISQHQLSSPSKLQSQEEVLNKSRQVEARARKSLNTLIRDCKRYCKIMQIKGRITFADEVGKELCHYRTVASEGDTSPTDGHQICTTNQSSRNF